MDNNKLKQLLEGGIDHYNFKRIIFSETNRVWFDKVSYIELKEVVESIKSNNIGLYTFLPFCYIFLGIDLFYYYEEQLNDEWKDCSSCISIAKDFERYNVKLHYDSELNDTLDQFNISKDYLNKIRRKLVKQGAKPVKLLRTMGSDKVERFPII